MPNETGTPTSFSISELHAKRESIRASSRGLPDNIFDKLDRIADELELAILKAPCACGHDLRLKLSVWDDLIKDPACLMEWHLDLWEVLKADMWRVAGRVSVPTSALDQAA